MAAKHKKKTGLLITLFGVALAGLAIVGVLVMLRERNEGKYFMVVNAASGSTDGSTLTLQNLETQSLLFADRPDRAVRYISPHSVVGFWNTEFYDDPPNAAITWREGDSTYTMVVELTQPKLQHDGSLVFSYIPLSDETDVFSETMEDVSIFVDAFPATVDNQITD